VHDTLGECVGHFPKNQEELEEMANARVLDEIIFCRDANTHRVESREARYQPVQKIQLPQWCPEGLTRTQKRRMQRERQEELNKEESSFKSKNRQQADPKRGGLSADVNMVFMLPMEFLAPLSDDEETSLPDQIAQLALDPMIAIFEKPSDEDSILRLCLSKAGLMGSQVPKYLLTGEL